MLGDPQELAKIILAKRKTVKSARDEDDDEGLTSAAEELIAALGSKDPRGVVGALRSAFAQMESQPHTETEHDS